jgi:hypothetical protein
MIKDITDYILNREEKLMALFYKSLCITKYYVGYCPTLSAVYFKHTPDDGQYPR